MMPLKVKFQRWPGQKMPNSLFSSSENKYGWTHKSCGPMGRFGGGWRWKLGLEMDSKGFILNLIYGLIRVSWEKK